MNEKQQYMIDEWSYFCTRVNFGKSALDARAINFMNTFEKLIMEIEN